MTTPFYFVDVFASEPLTGNPLALIPDADALTEEQMRAIAREFNQSETTFILRPTLPSALWRLRSFTPPGAEVLGAGHNAMGAWLWLAHAGRLPAAEKNFIQQIGDNPLPVEVDNSTGSATEVIMDQSAPVPGAKVTDQSALAAALGIAEDDLLAEETAQVFSTGAAHLLVGVRNRHIVDNVRPDTAELAAVLRTVEGQGCYVYSHDPVDPAGGSVAYSRFFNPTVGIVEDPATGTAAGPLAARLAASGRIAAGTPVIIEQGHRLGRPSKLRLTIDGERVRLSGSGVVVAEGVLRV